MIPRQLGLYISQSNNRDDIKSFAFYIAISDLCHEGVIHNYRSIILSLRTKLNISESCFRRLLSQCKRDGYLFEDEAGGLRFRSSRKILDREVKDHPHIFENKKGRIRLSIRNYQTQFKTYKEIKVWIQSLALFNKSVQQNYAEYKLQLKNGTNKNNIPRAFQRNSFYLSRNHIACILGYKSSTSSTYFMRKLKCMGILNKDNHRNRYVRSITGGEYKEVYSIDNRYYYHNGGLYRRLINELQLNTSSFIPDPLTSLIQYKNK